MEELERENDYRDEHFDFIQQHIRKFSLSCIFLCGKGLDYFLIKSCEILFA